MNFKQQFEIKPATNLKDLYQNLQITSGLDVVNMDYYVPIYEEQIKEIVEKLEFSYNPSDTFFIAGQVGSGKTTLIDYLVFSQKEITDKYEFLYVDYVEEVQLADRELEVSEIISVLITKISKLLYDFNIDIRSYQKRLIQIEQQARIDYVDSAKNKWALSDILTEILGNNLLFGLGLKLDTSKRTTIREIFKSNLRDFINLLNDLIIDLNRFHPENKTLLVFLDGLEKIQEDSVINNIFNPESLNTLTSIQCRKMIAIPVHLTSRETAAIDPSIGHFIAVQCKIKLNPLTMNDDAISEIDKVNSKKRVDENRSNLKLLVRKRIATGSQLMIPDDTLEHALNLSGGFVVDFCKILADAIINASVAKSEIVLLEYVKKATDYLGAIKSQTFTLDSKAINTLYHVLETNKKDNQDNNKTLIRQLLLKNIIFNLNNTLCYFVHPLIETSVRIYGKPTQENPEG